MFVSSIIPDASDFRKEKVEEGTVVHLQSVGGSQSLRYTLESRQDSFPERGELRTTTPLGRQLISLILLESDFLKIQEQEIYKRI
jgi:transcription elongation GreA/GreB family factor